MLFSYVSLASGIVWGLSASQLCQDELSIPTFQSSFIKPSLELCLVTPKEGIVTLRVAGLTVPGCKGLPTMVWRPTYVVLSRDQFCRGLRAHGRGGSQKVTSDDEGEGGGEDTPQK